MNISEIEMVTEVEETSRSIQVNEQTLQTKFDSMGKWVLLCAFYILCLYQDDQLYYKLLNIILFTSMVLLSRRHKWDLLFTIIATICAIVYLFTNMTVVLFIGQLFVSFTVITLNTSQRLLKECKLVWGEIKNLSITMIFVVLICSYVATAYYKDDANAAQYYKTFGRSVITMIQALSLDDWAQIGRQTQDLFGYIFLCVYILLMTYFYINVMMGLLLDTLAKDKKGLVQSEDPFNYESNQKRILNDIIHLTTLDQILIGKYYEIIVFLFSFGAVFLSVFNDFEEADNTLEYVIGLIDDVIYTLHFFLIYFVMQGKIYQLEKKSKLMFLLHLLAGPISLVLTLMGGFEVGCLFNLLKVATTPSVKGIFRGTLNIIPLLLPQFTQLLGIIMVLSSILTTNYFFLVGSKKQMYFNSFWDSVYTLVQVMTLDDWAAVIAPMYDRHEAIMPYILLPTYIVISNFIILNTLIALSCEYFVEIKYEKVERLELKHFRSATIVNINKIKEYCQLNQVPLNIPKVLINDNDTLNLRLQNNEVFQIMFNDARFTVQACKFSDGL